MIKRLFNKRYLKLLLSLLVLVLILVSTYYIDLFRFNSKLVKYDSDYLMKITYLIADRDKLEDGISIDDTIAYHEEDIIYNASQVVPLTKDGDTGYVDLSKFTNSKMLDHVTDAIYAKNNINGEDIEGCSYDKEKRILRVPFSYFENLDKDNPMPIQAEIESLLTRSEINNLKTNFSVKKLITYTDTAKNELFQLNTKISLAQYVNGNIASDNVFVYVNGSNKALDKGSFSYDSSTETLTISMPAILINKVDIRLGNNIIKNVFADGYWASELDGYKLKSRPTALINRGTYNDYYTVALSHSEGVDSSQLIYCYGGQNTHPSCKDMSYGAVADDNYAGLSYEKTYLWDDSNQWYYSFWDSWGDYYVFPSQSHIIPYIVETSYAGMGEDGVRYLDFADDEPVKYILMECSHITEGSSPYSTDPVQVGIHIVSDGFHPDENYLVLEVHTYAKGRDYNGWGGQYGTSYFKVYWEENQKCNLPATKTVSSFSNDGGTGTATVGLYSDSNCTSLIQSKTINVGLNNGASGSTTFNDLNLNTTYYVQETAFTDPNSNNLLTNRYTNISGCKGITTTDSNGDGVCDTGASMINEQKSYCYSIKKVDAENGGVAVANTSWELRGADGTTKSATTNSSGIATFTGLKYQNYTLVETTANPADLDSNGTLDYWNDNGGNGTSVAASSLTLGSACNSPVTKTDKKVYYCIKVKKTDYNTGNALAGAEFTATKGNITINKNSNNYSSSNGITSFFIGDSSKAGNYTITETLAPSGYTIETATKTVAAISMSEYVNEGAARTACLSDSATASDGSTIASKTYNSNSGNNNYVFKDKKQVINWYKTTENGSTLVNGAEFKVKNSSGQYITVSAPVSQTDASNVTKACYQYTGTNSTGTVMTSGTNGSTNISMTGQVCVSGLPSGTYIVVETKAPEYHTFGSSSTISVTVGNTFNTMTNSNKLVNYSTEFKFTKRVTNIDGTQEDNTKYTVTIGGVTKTVSLSEMTTEELMKIGFSIYDSNGNVVPVKQISSGHYEYGSNSVDQAGSSTNVTVLHLDANREIDVKHLPKGTYTIKEVDTSSCGLNNGGYGIASNPTSRPASAPSCALGGTGNGNCIGYYSPDYSSNTYSFTVNDCSSTNAASNSTSCKSSDGIETQSLTNTPTEITFTKKDLYSYQDQSDIVDNNREQNSTESNVEFENAKERSDFDRIDFKVKDSNGNYLNFIYVGNTSNTCGSDSDYSVYRYVPGLQLPSGVDPNVFNYHTSTGGLTITQTLHACGGHIKLVGLCRGETYTFEEIKVPDDSVYVLEKQGASNPEVCFEVPCSTNEEEHRTSKTAVINDKPTRVIFEKRDGKYNYLIPDETTTFEVYRCPSDSLCNPSAYNTVAEREAAGMKLIKFEPRGLINNDEEDSGIEVYRMMSDSDAANKTACSNNQTSNCYVTSVNPDAGRLVLRYLQSGYNYVLLETVAPVNYMLPIGTRAETPFTVVSTTVSVEEVNVPNSPTALIIRKYADVDGDNQADSAKLLGGAKFKVYKVTNYNANKKVKDQEKEIVRLKTIKDGIYENRPVLDTDVITTCTGNNCSYSLNSLGYDSSQWESIDDLIEKTGNNITSVLREGTAIVQYLEYDTYYIVEEVEAPVGYSLPENDDDRFTLVHIRANETQIVDTEDALVNKPTSFTFYKFDEYNTPLDGATFYLQKLDSDKKYNTLTVSMETLENGSIIYKADPNSELTDITTRGGKATVYYLEPGQYRILEVEAADGYELPKKTVNVATFYVDDDGLVYGNNIITNKKPQDTIEYLADSKAELIINIQTGKTVIKYGLIITALIGAIVGLMILLKKRK